jgi:hypothetical protein
MDDLDFSSLFILLGLMLGPAIVVFTIFTIIRVRRGKFHRQRITKKSSRDE